MSNPFKPPTRLYAVAKDAESSLLQVSRIDSGAADGSLNIQDAITIAGDKSVRMPTAISADGLVMSVADGSLMSYSDKEFTKPVNVATNYSVDGPIFTQVAAGSAFIGAKLVEWAENLIVDLSAHVGKTGYIAIQKSTATLVFVRIMNEQLDRFSQQSIRDFLALYYPLYLAHYTGTEIFVCNDSSPALFATGQRHCTVHTSSFTVGTVGEDTVLIAGTPAYVTWRNRPIVSLAGPIHVTKSAGTTTLYGNLNPPGANFYPLWIGAFLAADEIAAKKIGVVIDETCSNIAACEIAIKSFNPFAKLSADLLELPLTQIGFVIVNKTTKDIVAIYEKSGSAEVPFPKLTDLFVREIISSEPSATDANTAALGTILFAGSTGKMFFRSAPGLHETFVVESRVAADAATENTIVARNNDGKIRAAQVIYSELIGKHGIAITKNVADGELTVCRDPDFDFVTGDPTSLVIAGGGTTVTVGDTEEIAGTAAHIEFSLSGEGNPIVGAAAVLQQDRPIAKYLAVVSRAGVTGPRFEYIDAADIPDTGAAGIASAFPLLAVYYGSTAETNMGIRANWPVGQRIQCATAKNAMRTVRITSGGQIALHDTTTLEITSEIRLAGNGWSMAIPPTVSLTQYTIIDGVSDPWEVLARSSPAPFLDYGLSHANMYCAFSIYACVGTSDRLFVFPCAYFASALSAMVDHFSASSADDGHSIAAVTFFGMARLGFVFTYNGELKMYYENRADLIDGTINVLAQPHVAASAGGAAPGPAENDDAGFRLGDLRIASGATYVCSDPAVPTWDKILVNQLATSDIPNGTVTDVKLFRAAATAATAGTFAVRDDAGSAAFTAVTTNTVKAAGGETLLAYDATYGAKFPNLLTTAGAVTSLGNGIAVVTTNPSTYHLRSLTSDVLPLGYNASGDGGLNMIVGALVSLDGREIVVSASSQAATHAFFRRWIVYVSPADFSWKVGNDEDALGNLSVFGAVKYTHATNGTTIIPYLWTGAAYTGKEPAAKRTGHGRISVNSGARTLNLTGIQCEFFGQSSYSFADGAPFAGMIVMTETVDSYTGKSSSEFGAAARIVIYDVFAFPPWARDGEPQLVAVANRATFATESDARAEIFIHPEIGISTGQTVFGVLGSEYVPLLRVAVRIDGTIIDISEQPTGAIYLDGANAPSVNHDVVYGARRGATVAVNGSEKAYLCTSDLAGAAAWKRMVFDEEVSALATAGALAKRSADGSLAVKDILMETGGSFSLGGQMMLIYDAGSRKSLHIGYGAGTASTDGATRNIFVGEFAGKSVTTGNNNIAIGNDSLKINTTGSHNTAIGNITLHGLTRGSGNLVLGNNSGLSYTNLECDNILLMNYGVAGESGKIRIGKTGTHTDTYLTGDIHMPAKLFVTGDVDIDGTLVAPHDSLTGLTNGTYGDAGHANLLVAKVSNVAPTADDDVTANKVGTIWLNSATNDVYMCFSNTDGGADWRKLYDSSDFSSAETASSAVARTSDGSVKIHDLFFSGVLKNEGEVVVFHNRYTGELRSSGANCFVGHDAGSSIVADPVTATGTRNVFLGDDSGKNVTTGSRNIVVGDGTGLSLTGSDSDNIIVGNAGVVGDNGTIRLGTTNTHTKTYLVGTVTAPSLKLTGLAAATPGNVIAAIDGTLSIGGAGSVDGTAIADSSLNGSKLVNSSVAEGKLATAVASAATASAIVKRGTQGEIYATRYHNESGRMLDGTTHSLATLNYAYPDFPDFNTNSCVGYDSGYSLTVPFGVNKYPSFNTLLGRNSGWAMLGDSIGNVAIGHSALTPAGSYLPSYCVAVGYKAMGGDTEGANSYLANCVAIGANTMPSVSGSGNIAVGTNALLVLSSGIENTALGTNALKLVTTGNNNIAVGHNAGSVHGPTDYGNIDIGHVGVLLENGVVRVGTNQTKTYLCGTVSAPNVTLTALAGAGGLAWIGTDGAIGVASGGALGSTAIADGSITTIKIAEDAVTDDKLASAPAAASNPNTLVKRDASSKVAASTFITSITSGAVLESIDGAVLVKFSIANENFAAGSGAGNMNATQTTAIGSDAGSSNTSTYGTFIGWQAGAASTATKTTAVGWQAGRHLTGEGNCAVGPESMFGVVGGTSTGTYNAALGQSSLRVLTSGTENVAIGFESMIKATSGASNTCVGYKAGNGITTGSGSIYFGNLSGSNSAYATSTKNIHIGYNGTVTESNAIRLGNILDHLTTYLVGTINMAGLAGTGVRQVVASADGSLTTQAITTFGAGSITDSMLASVPAAAGTANTLAKRDADGKLTSTSFVTSQTSGTMFETAAGASLVKFHATNEYVAIGSNAGNMTSTQSVAIGQNAGVNNVGTCDVFIGWNAGADSVSNHSTVVGHNAGRNIRGGGNCAFGMESMMGAVGTTCTGSGNMCLGNGTLRSFTTAADNVAIGVAAMYSVTEALSSFGLGRESLYKLTTGSYNIAIGHGTMYNLVSDSYNVAIGHYAMNKITTGGNTAIGREAMKLATTATNTVAIGSLALGGAILTGIGNTAIGASALTAATSGASNTCVGNSAGMGVTTGSNNIYLGVSAGSDASLAASTTNIHIGYVGTEAENGAIRIGTAGTQTKTYLVGGVVSSENTKNFTYLDTGVEYTLITPTTSSGCIVLGRDAAIKMADRSGPGINSVIIGQLAGNALSDGGESVMIGHSAGKANISGVKNVFLGLSAGIGNTGSQNVAIGANAYGNTAANTGSNNTAVGAYALVAGGNSSTNNTVLGHSAAYSATGGYNVILGTSACYNTTSAVRLVAVGYLAGRWLQSTGSIAIGANSLSGNRGAGQTLVTTGPHTAIGDACLGLIQDTSAYNTAVGYGSMANTTISSNNTAFGHLSLNAHGASSGANTAIGANSLLNLLTGTNNVAIGSGSGNALVGAESNNILIAAAGVAADSGVIRLGTAGTHTATYFVGTMNMAGLAGTGSRFVVTDANGVLSASADSIGTISDAMLASVPATAGTANTLAKRDTNGKLTAASFVTSATSGTIFETGAGAAMMKYDTTNENLALGGGAGNMTASQTVAIGQNAGASNAALFSTMVGWNAGSGSIANQTCAFGWQAARYARGPANCAFGTDSMLGNAGGASTGECNICIGHATLRAFTTASDNVAIGGVCMWQATTSLSCVGIGREALWNLRTGNYNTAIGRGALYTSNSAHNNTAIGYFALNKSEVGGNTAIGYNAMARSVSAVGIVAIGAGALSGALSGNNNTAIGSSAMSATTSGGSNTCIGESAGTNVTTGSNNIYIGASAGSNAALATSTKNIHIGYVGTGAESGIIRLGNATDNTATYLVGSITMANLAGTGVRFVSANANGVLSAAAIANGEISDAMLASVPAVAGTANTLAKRDANAKLAAASFIVSPVSGTIFETAAGLALMKYSVANENIALGNGAGNAAATYAISIGHGAGATNTSANVTFVGWKAGTASTASWCTAVGYMAGYYLAGTGNCAYGTESMQGQIGGVSTGSHNLAFGHATLRAVTSGSDNVAVGSACMNQSTTSGACVGIGREALYTLSTGANHIAIGRGALYSVSTASDNTAIGYYAGNALTAGTNTAIGFSAMRKATTAVNTVAIGSDSLANAILTGAGNTAVGTATLYATTSGANNTCVGFNAGNGVTTGSDNMYLGYNSGSNVALAASTKNIHIGYVGTGAESNTIRLGNATDHTATHLVGTVTMVGLAGTGARPIVANADGSLAAVTSVPASIADGAVTDVMLASAPDTTATLSTLVKRDTNAKIAAVSFVVSPTAGTIFETAAGLALMQYSAGNNTISFGDSAGNTDATKSVLAGYQAGKYALGSMNCAFGYESMLGVTGGASTGSNNSAYGQLSLRAITSGFGNVAIGNSSMESATEALSCVGIGNCALGSLTTGDSHIAIGDHALYKAVTSNYNVAVGHSALYNSTGSNNTAIGFNSLTGVLSGSSNIAVGYNSGSALAGTESGNILIGSVGVATEGYTIRIGSTTQTAMYVSTGIYGSSVGATNTALYMDDTGKVGPLASSARYKANITPMEDTSYVHRLRPVNFTYKADPTARKQYGFIAEEVAEVNPLFVRFNDAGQPEGLNETPLLMAMMGEMLAMKKEMVAMRAEIAALRGTG